MLRQAAAALRLRPCTHLHTAAAAAKETGPVARRLADKHHRTVYRTLELESARYRASPVLLLQPTIKHFLVWLQKRHEGRPELVAVKNGHASSHANSAMETALFHLLTALDDPEWAAGQAQSVASLLLLLTSHRNYRKCVPILPEDLASALGSTLSEPQTALLRPVLHCISVLSPAATANDVACWVRSVHAPTVESACSELANLARIPECVLADIVLRTPLSKEELSLQLDVWKGYAERMAKAYHEKTSQISSIIYNLAYFTVQFGAYKLPTLIRSTFDVLTSTKSGYQFRVITPQFANLLLLSLALYHLRSSAPGSQNSSVSIIKAQEPIVQYLSHKRLSQQGYVGIALAVFNESPEKAARLFEISQNHFREHSTYYHFANIHLATTPEQLMHNFNVALSQHPNSAATWLIFIKKLQAFELLNEQRAQNLLKELASRKALLLISKDVVLTLLNHIETVNGIEQFVGTLEAAQLLSRFQKIVRTRYMALLYQFSTEKNVRKPYLDRFVKQSSNLNCARYIYNSMEQKSVSSVGIMLNGEVHHRPQEIYDLYVAELGGRAPDESCLVALMRASLKQVDNGMVWNEQMLAPQIAVHEFKKYVCRETPTDDTIGIVPSAKLWKWYVEVLVSAKYVAELAEIIRWWEVLEYVPPKSTLLLLLRSLPGDFVLRHLKHVNSVPKNSSFVLSWPWPRADELDREV